MRDLNQAMIKQFYFPYGGWESFFPNLWFRSNYHCRQTFNHINWPSSDLKNRLTILNLRNIFGKVLRGSFYHYRPTIVPILLRYTKYYYCWKSLEIAECIVLQTHCEMSQFESNTFWNILSMFISKRNWNLEPFYLDCVSTLPSEINNVGSL